MLLAQGVDHIVVLALYPQYSCSTVAAVWDELARILATRRRIPGVTFIRDYADNDSISRRWQQRARVVCKTRRAGSAAAFLSRHPAAFANEGDDYPQRCRDTTRELVSALGLPPEKVMMTFQSRFGREPWLTPYTDETLKMLGEKGVKHIQVMSPGFSADCLETLEEIAVQNREFFLEAGGEIRVHSGA
jgi:ferrochelatase